MRLVWELWTQDAAECLEVTPSEGNEGYLFHGTNPDAASAICRALGFVNPPECFQRTLQVKSAWSMEQARILHFKTDLQANQTSKWVELALALALYTAKDFQRHDFQRSLMLFSVTEWPELWNCVCCCRRETSGMHGGDIPGVMGA